VTSPRLRSTALLLSLLLTLLTVPAVRASTLPPRGHSVAGADISWPNCPRGMGIPGRRSPGNPMPPAGSKYAVVGLTNGPAFFPNPCLARQVAWVKARHLWLGAYSVVSYPTAAQLKKHGGAGTLLTRVRRVGVAEARFNLTSLRRAGVRKPPMVWVDVEPVRSAPWSRSTAANNALLDGALAGYRAAGVRVGIYSYRYGWKEITGGRRLPKIPTWVPLSTCSKRSFSGGPVWMTQTTSRGSDLDKTCAALSGTGPRRHPLTRYARTTLRTGSHGPAVVALQKRLAVAADGAFGPRTKGKVVRFQRSHRLPATGVVERRTWKALGAGTLVPGRPSRFPALFAST
jgi:hypothetical protein